MFRGSSHCSTSLPSHRRISTMSSQDLSQRNLHRGICNYKLRVYNSSLQHNHLCTKRIGTKSKHNHLYTRGIRHKAKTLTQSQSPLHKRDGYKAKSQPQSPLHKRDRHKAKFQPQSPLPREIGIKPKQRKDYNLSDPMITNNTW